MRAGAAPCEKSSPSRIRHNRRIHRENTGIGKKVTQKATHSAGRGRPQEVARSRSRHSRVSSRFMATTVGHPPAPGKPPCPECTNDGTLVRWHQPATSMTDGDRFWRSCSSERRLAMSRCESGYAGWCGKTEEPLGRTSKRLSLAGRSGCPSFGNSQRGFGKSGRISAPVSPESCSPWTGRRWFSCTVFRKSPSGRPRLTS